MTSFYLVEIGPDGKFATRLNDLTAPKMARIFETVWPSRKCMRLRTSLNQLAEARTGRRTPAAGNGQDRIVRFPLADAAD